MNYPNIYLTSSPLMGKIYSFLLLLPVCVLAATEPEPRAIGNFEGRVIKRASGQLDVSNGHYCAKFPNGKTTPLAPYLGKFVDVEYSLTPRGDPLGRMDFGQIQRVHVIEETSDVFPISVRIEPVKSVFDSAEPIIAKVVLENLTGRIQSLRMSGSHAVLFMDYEKILWLESDKHERYPFRSYRFEGESNIEKLNPNERMVFTVESRHMAKPGKYDLSYVLSFGIGERYCVSKSAPIEVTDAVNGNRVAVLKTWLKTASLEQRIEIANELADKGDSWAVEEFLSQLKTGMYMGDAFFYRNAYAFAFKHGGKAGEELMVDLIEHDKFQESATEFIRFAFISKNRLELLTRFTACQHAVEINLSGWVEHPRICDIASDILTQQTKGQMQFPRKGSEAERNESVLRVQNALKENSQIFDGLDNDKRGE